MTWSYLATRLNGDGSETVLDPELPLRNVSITEYRNAPTELSAEIEPEYLQLLDAAGLPVLRPWSSAIYVEKDGEIRAGSILADDPVDGPTIQLDGMGFAGYPNGQPYTEASTWPANPPETDLDPELNAEVEENVAIVAPTPTTRAVYNPRTKVTTALGAWEVNTPPATGGFADSRQVAWPSPTAAPGTTDYPVDGMEPMFAIREIWRHLQSQPGGNLGIQIDPMVTGRKIGKLVAQGEFDTVNGPLSFEFEPLLLRWYETHDLGDVINDLCENLPLDFREIHSWNEDRDAILHYIQFGYPRLGSRRDDAVFVIGENVDPVSIESPSEEYASEVLGLGAGDGPNMIRGTATRGDETRIRRAVVFEDKAARTAAAIAISSRRELAARVGLDEVSTINVRPDHVDDLAHLMPGDEVFLVGEQPHRDVEMWVRIESKTTLCDTNGLTFDVQRVESIE